uniref:Pentatricopeptide repeat-containing protein n=1 Tax=Chenopodium quinoa TaxID=63459 RepID=A0A803KMQ3_CHEQI
MQSRGNCKPGIVIYNTIIDSLCKDRLLQQAINLFSAMKIEGIQPDVVTYTSLVRGFYNSGFREEAKDGLVVEAEAILRHMTDKGVAPDITVLYLMKGITPDVVTYNTLIDGLCKTNRLTLARELFTDMQAHGVTPDVFTYNSLLDCLCKSAQLDEAVALLEDMEDTGIKPDIVTYNILIDSLCKAGQLEDAANFFSNLVIKGLQPSFRTYNILVKGFCKKGLMNEATQLLSKMAKDDCFPNGITYNIIIGGYILSNDFTKALYYRDLMVSKGFEADADTFALFVDLLSSENLSDSSKGLLQKFIK